METNITLESYIQKESFFKSVVEDGSDIIFIVDYDGKILYHNPAVSNVLGYPPRSLFNSSFYDYIIKDDLEQFKVKFQECAKFPYSKNIEFQFRKSDGAYQFLEFNSINLKHKDGINGLILDCRDITQLKKHTEELLIAKQVKEQFLANMSHEIRTPMNGISGMVSLLTDTNPTAEQIKYLNAIKNSTDNLKVIINDILDLSALESGKLKFEKIGFRVSNLIPQVVEMFLPQAKEKGINLDYNFVPGSEMVLLGDPTRLSQVLINLISNAIKFTYSGEIKVSFRISKKINETAYAHFEITDTGVGIPANKLESIFDSFSQADESVTRKFGGTGLGLTIVKQLVDLQNGSIYVTSKENDGSSFSFTIPYQIGTAEDLLLDQSIQNLQKVGGSLPGMEILVVEDNDINRLYATTILKGWGCKIEQAENGLICLEKLKKKDYDVILMDVQMPVMDGFETTVTIRNSFDKPKSEIPIIALTANAIKGDNDKCIALGMNDYLSKPFVPGDLFNLISKYFLPQDKKPKAIVKDKEFLKDVDGSLTNLNYLRSISNEDSTFISEMINTFLEATPGSLVSMGKAMKEKDLSTVGKLAHKIKPSLTFMGIDSLKDIVVDIETKGKEGTDEDLLKKLVPEFITTVNSAMGELKTKLSKFI